MLLTLIMNRTLHGGLKIWTLFSCVKKTIFLLLATLVHKTLFSLLENKTHIHIRLASDSGFLVLNAGFYDTSKACWNTSHHVHHFAFILISWFLLVYFCRVNASFLIILKVTLAFISRHDLNLLFYDILCKNNQYNPQKNPQFSFELMSPCLFTRLIPRLFSLLLVVMLTITPRSRYINMAALWLQFSARFEGLSY